MTVSALLKRLTGQFSRAKLHYGHGTHSAREEAAWLISSVLGFLLEQELNSKQIQQINALAARRIRERIPLAYLLKEAWLGEHSFYVDERVIVPRSFIAELLRERLSPWLAREPKHALDLCTGSGCLAVLLALKFEKARVDAADVSVDALAVARKNVDRYKLSKRVNIIRSNLFEKLVKYDLIACNPPYVTARSMRKLPKEYRHEPRLALAGGDDGLKLVREVIEKAKQHLRPGGLLVCEIGGNRRALERAYPKIEFAWPETSEGAGSVFILAREQLPGASAAGGSRTSTRSSRVP